jgi:molybdopterin synthase sulfur carrier subunit
MSIHVKFFASLRETVGRDEQHLDAAGLRTVRDVWRRACRELALPENALMAVNMDYVRGDDPVQDGDEVAFFPPVTGG